MKTAILVNQYPSVSHTFVRREIAALTTLGVDVERFTIRATPTQQIPDPLDLEEREKTHALLGGGVMPLLRNVARLMVQRPGKFAAAFALATKLGRRSDRGLIRNYAYLAEACSLVQETAARDVEHVHAHFGTNSAAVAMLSHELGGPSYSFTAHGPEEFDGPGPLSLREKIARSAFVVGVSEFGRSQLLRHTEAERWGDIHVVRCGLDAEFLGRPRTSVPDVNELVCVGRLCEQKGQLVLIEALAKLKQRGVSARLKLVGDGPMRALIEQRIQEHGLEDSVTITGWASSAAVLEAIEGARAMVLPSFAEGLPVVLMEAMARGRPVITTFVAGIPELVDDQVGVVVPAGSVDALANAMETLLTRSPQKLTDMGRRASHRVAAKHDALRSALTMYRLFRHYAGAQPGLNPAVAAEPAPRLDIVRAAE